MQRKIYSLILKFAVAAFLPEMVYAAGTYYSGNYNSPQRNYTTNGFAGRQQNAGYNNMNNNAMYNNRGYNTTNTSYSRDTSYTRTRTGVVPNNNAYIGGSGYQNYTRIDNGEQVQQTQQRRVKKSDSSQKSGFSLGAAFTHEFANWNFEMNSAGSMLHYDNIRWNVFDVMAKYDFNVGSTMMRLDAGVKYGMQFGDSTMVDDDITNGGYVITEWNDWTDTNGNGQIDSGELTYLGEQVGHSLSIGNSSSGDMLGFHAGLGLPALFNMGAARVTPSVGFRYLKYKLDTKNDYGLTVDTGVCDSPAGSDEIQCDPIVIFYDSTSNTQQVIWESQGTYGVVIPANETHVSTGGTYMFKLPSVSHSYETTWMGPYFALDLDYDINANNAINARFELGLPLYTSEGDQPYRPDWEHPTSVKDEGSFGDAWHVGLGANYMTALSDSVALTIGFTFDYYTLSGGSASTYLNKSWYMDIYNELLDYYVENSSGMTAAEVEEWMRENDPTVMNIIQTEEECPGWICKVDNEIKSIYKSMGIRVGIQARF